MDPAVRRAGISSRTDRDFVSLGRTAAQIGAPKNLEARDRGMNIVGRAAEGRGEAKEESMKNQGCACRTLCLLPVFSDQGGSLPHRVAAFKPSLLRRPVAGAPV